MTEHQTQLNDIVELPDGKRFQVVETPVGGFRLAKDQIFKPPLICVDCQTVASTVYADGACRNCMYKRRRAEMLEYWQQSGSYAETARHFGVSYNRTRGLVHRAEMEAAGHR